MRNTFAEALYLNAIKNNKISIVVADISIAGNMIKFQKKYPKRFINVGVSEMTMISLCAGMALEGRRPFAYTIANFSLYRPFEMIRNDLCLQNLPVTVVGMGAGTVYSTLGSTHLTQEDIAIARSIPNMNIISPCDPLELEAAVNYCANISSSPVYLRIGKTGEKTYTDNLKTKWKFGKIRKILNGKEICFLSHGSIIRKCFSVKDLLKKFQIKPSIYSVSTLKPIDKNGLKKILNKYKHIIVLEDHSEIGGLGEIVKVEANNNNIQKKITCFNLKDKFLNNYGSQDDLLNDHGISEIKIFKTILNLIK